jgi:hypothetical protein
MIIVIDDAGRETTGILRDLSSSVLTLLTDGEPRQRVFSEGTTRSGVPIRSATVRPWG